MLHAKDDCAVPTEYLEKFRELDETLQGGGRGGTSVLAPVTTVETLCHAGAHRRPVRTPLIAHHAFGGTHAAMWQPQLSQRRLGGLPAVARDVEEHLHQILPPVAHQQLSRAAAVDDAAAL